MKNFYAGLVILLLTAANGAFGQKPYTGYIGWQPIWEFYNNRTVITNEDHGVLIDTPDIRSEFNTLDQDREQFCAVMETALLEGKKQAESFGLDYGYMAKHRMGASASIRSGSTRPFHNARPARTHDGRVYSDVGSRHLIVDAFGTGTEAMFSLVHNVYNGELHIFTDMEFRVDGLRILFYDYGQDGRIDAIYVQDLRNPYTLEKNSWGFVLDEEGRLWEKGKDWVPWGEYPDCPKKITRAHDWERKIYDWVLHPEKVLAINTMTEIVKSGGLANII